MKSHSVLFLGDCANEYNDGKNKLHNNVIGQIINYFTISPHVLSKRIALAFVPPVLGERSRHVYVDFVGPCLAIFTLATIMHYGYAYKHPAAAPTVSPSHVLLYYCTSFLLGTYTLAKLGQAKLALVEVAALLGYGLFGHVFTLAVSQLFDHEQSNIVFFINLIIFGGLSGLRVALILLASISSPVSRLIVCSVTTIVHLMFVVLVHFAYMHSTFVYGAKAHKL